MSTCILLVVITITEKLVLSAVAQRIIVKFVTKENVKPADILIRLRAQFRDETLSRIQMYDWTKSFEEGRTEIENTRRLQLLHEKLWPALLLLPRRLIKRITEQRTISKHITI